MTIEEMHEIAGSKVVCISVNYHPNSLEGKYECFIHHDGIVSAGSANTEIKAFDNALVVMRSGS